MGRKRRKNRLGKLIVGIICLVLVFTIGYYNDDTQNCTNTIETAISFDLNSIPEYKDEPYVVINNNIPDFAEEDYIEKSFEKYSPLDSLGRCGVAYANICKETMPVEGEKRENISSIRPTGWHSVKYEGLVEGDYLYNRSHLIGWQLSAENDNELNLIAGTRYMNVQGMLPFENLISDYLQDEKTEDNHVLYRVTPIFEGNNLVASGVQMEAYSIEDNGEGICFNVYVYNVQPGITIDYATGNSSIKTE